MVLGIPDFWIWSAYALCILSTLLCTAYGIINWNKGEDETFRSEAEKTGSIEM